MKKGYSRPQRVADLIQTTLADILQKDAENYQLGMITITSASISKDLSFAKIYVSVLDESKAAETIAALNNVAKNLRYELAHAVKLRITPELKFYYDDSGVRGQRMSSLINDALKGK